MNPKHHEFLAHDRIADMGRNVAGDQRMARAAADAHVATSTVGRLGWIARVRLPRFMKLSRVIARLVEG